MNVEWNRCGRQVDEKERGEREKVRGEREREKNYKIGMEQSDHSECGQGTRLAI